MRTFDTCWVTILACGLAACGDAPVSTRLADRRPGVTVSGPMLASNPCHANNLAYQVAVAQNLLKGAGGKAMAQAAHFEGRLVIPRREPKPARNDRVVLDLSGPLTDTRSSTVAVNLATTEHAVVRLQIGPVELRAVSGSLLIHAYVPDTHVNARLAGVEFQEVVDGELVNGCRLGLAGEPALDFPKVGQPPQVTQPPGSVPEPSDATTEPPEPPAAQLPGDVSDFDFVDYAGALGSDVFELASELFWWRLESWAASFGLDLDELLEWLGPDLAALVGTGDVSFIPWDLL